MASKILVSYPESLSDDRLESKRQAVADQLGVLPEDVLVTTEGLSMSVVDIPESMKHAREKADRQAAKEEEERVAAEEKAAAKKAKEEAKAAAHMASHPTSHPSQTARTASGAAQEPDYSTSHPASQPTSHPPEDPGMRQNTLENAPKTPKKATTSAHKKGKRHA